MTTGVFGKQKISLIIKVTPRVGAFPEKLIGPHPVKKFPAFLWNPKIHYHMHKRLPPVAILSQSTSIYTECNSRNGPDFGRVFLRSYYTDITQNTYIQSSMVTEILAREF